MPASLQTAARLAFVGTRVTRGPRSFLTYVRLSRIRHHEGSGGHTVPMRLRPLGRRPMAIRPSTSDIDTVWSTFAGAYHRPPPEALDRELALIWDLGANVGLTMADLAVRHPRARVVGVELDPENAALARRNVEPWADRCEVVEAAVWPTGGTLSYRFFAGATAGHHVVGGSSGEDPAFASARAITPGELLALDGPEAVVDYAKLDVEGAERELLREHTGWAARVRTIAVEVHAPYTVEECMADLRALGFAARRDGRHWAAVVGWRDATARPTS